MKHKLVLCLTTVLSSGLVGCSHPIHRVTDISFPDIKSLCERIEHSLSSKIPPGQSSGANGVARKLEFARVDSGHRQIDQQWSVGQQATSIHVRVEDNNAKASADVQNAVRLIFGAQKLPSFADEAYLSTSPATGACSLLFRKGNLFVSVGSSSEKTARQFAKDLLKSLP
jgi:hypothetical protein